ncbi:MAG: glycosyltransferase family 4 protein, partial [Verrucomicrobiae bacterium]|nr:glycosyltransferase family 4 protein [Verrucomicrobiae bacterium]
MIIAQITTDNREAYERYDRLVPEFGTAPTALFAGLSDRKDVELHILSCSKRAMSSPEKLGERTWFHGVHVPKFGWLRGGYGGCVLGLRHRLGQIGPDLVHGQGTERECALGAVFSGFPNVVTIHGNMARVARLYDARVGSYHWLTARLETLALRRAGGVFCNSSYTESVVRGRGFPRWLVPNAIRPSFLGPAASRPPQGVPILLNVGVIIPLKRQVELLSMARRLRGEGFRFQLRFAGHLGGDEEYNRRFRELLDSMAGTAFHDGALNEGELRDWLDAGTAMVHTSAEEACSVAVMEGIARNLKILAFNVGGNPDLVRGV